MEYLSSLFGFKFNIFSKSDAMSDCCMRTPSDSDARRKAFEELESRALIKNIDGLKGNPFVHLEHVNITYNREWDSREVEKVWYEAFQAAHDSREAPILKRLHDNKAKQIGLAWANFGHQQFHLPREEFENAPADVFKGVFGLEWPQNDFEDLQIRLNKLVPTDPEVRVERNIVPVHAAEVDDQLQKQLTKIDGLKVDNAFEVRFGGCQFRVHSRDCGDDSRGSHIGPSPWIDRGEYQGQPGPASRGLGIRYVECWVEQNCF